MKLTIRSKADPLPWHKNSLQLQHLLQGAWDEVSREWAGEVLAGFKSLDDAAIQSLIATSQDLGLQMSDLIGDKAEALFAAIHKDAHAYWTLYAASLIRPGDITDYAEYKTYLTQLQATQVKRFVQAHPGRILHPEIERQLEYLRQSRLTRSIDLQDLNERLTRILKQERYWAGTSDVHVARFWHSDNILLAAENGVNVGRIQAVGDQRTCPVCQKLNGTHVEIARAKEKIQRDLGIEDPDEYVEAWRFPRMGDVDNMSLEAVEKQGFTPPMHGRCRCQIQWVHT